MWSDARPVRWRPTAVEPVKATIRTTSLEMRCWEMSAGIPKTRLSTPAGSPASWNASAMCIAPAGVSSAALRMIEQPDARAPATFRAGWLIGKFQGENAATGPIGWWLTTCFTPGPLGMTRP